MKKISSFLFVSFSLIFSFSIRATDWEPSLSDSEYRVLILPGGGGTGINQIIALELIEAMTGLPTHMNFHQINAASIGAIMGSMLVKKDPMTASEVRHFIEEDMYGSYFGFGPKLAGYLKPLAYRGKVRAKLGQMAMSETKIPLNIMVSEIQTWKEDDYCSKETPHQCLSVFLPERCKHVMVKHSDQPHCSVPDAVCASSCVFPLYPGVEYIDGLDGIDKNIFKTSLKGERCFMDSGLRGKMDPLYQMLEDDPELSKLRKEHPNLVIYHLGNGWVDNSSLRKLPSDIPTKSITFDLKPVFEKWKKTWIGSWLYGSSFINNNMAGIGLVPLDLLKEASEDLPNKADFQEFIKDLPRSLPIK